MEYKVFGEKEKLAIFFKLVQDESTIDLRACDSFGRDLCAGNVLSIHKNGEIEVMGCINRTIGLKSVRVPEDLKTIKD